jgi:uncharacterized damage-inducible protein DinB
MNADAFRHFYNYHFAENRKIWDNHIISLSEAQFNQEIGYSHGSIRNQIIHLINVDHGWFSGLCGEEDPQPLDSAIKDNREIIRACWDDVERHMRQYLAQLRDDMLFKKPFAGGEDKDLILWQVLIHVVNHGTDHRAQILRQLFDLGIKTGHQDYIFYVYDNTM